MTYYIKSLYLFTRIYLFFMDLKMAPPLPAKRRHLQILLLPNSRRAVLEMGIKSLRFLLAALGFRKGERRHPHGDEKRIVEPEMGSDISLVGECGNLLFGGVLGESRDRARASGGNGQEEKSAK